MISRHPLFLDRLKYTNQSFNPLRREEAEQGHIMRIAIGKVLMIPYQRIRTSQRQQYMDYGIYYGIDTAACQYANNFRPFDVVDIVSSFLLADNPSLAPHAP